MFVLWLVLILSFSVYLVLAAVLVRKYVKTRDRGFLWLLVAVVGWPATCKILNSFMGRLMFPRHGFTVFPFSLVASGQMTVGELYYWVDSVEGLMGVSLILLAVFQFYKNMNVAKSTDAAPDAKIN